MKSFDVTVLQSFTANSANAIRSYFRRGSRFVTWLSSQRGIILNIGFGLIFCSPAFCQVNYELTVTPVYGRMYPPDRFVPIRIEARNNTERPVDGAIIIPVNEPNAATDFRIPLYSPARSMVILNAYAYLPAKVLTKLNEGSGSVPVAMAEWHNAQGATLSRTEVLGRPDTADRHDVADTRGFLVLSVTNGPQGQSGDNQAIREFSQFLAAQSPCAVNLGTAAAEQLPRHCAGYDAVRAIVFDAAGPDSLDVSQRETIMEYLRRGGTLILPAPMDNADPTGTWLEPYLPVQIIGSREMERIFPVGDSTGATPAPLKFTKPLKVVEAIDGAGEVLLRDRDYVHIAVRHIGLGQIVFTSFPLGALDYSDGRVAHLWQTILNLREPTQKFTDTSLGQHRDDILESMIGAPVSPWSYAAAIVGVYVLMTLLFQLFGHEARRPAAFIAGTILATGLFAMLIGITFIRQGSSKPLSVARIAAFQLGPHGGGTHEEAIAFLGRTDPDLALKADPRATLRPVVADANDPVTLDQLPFAAEHAGVFRGRVDRVWQADEAVPGNFDLRCESRFTPGGIQINVENDTGQTLLAPLVLWNRNCYRLPPLAPGRSSSILGEKNAPGDYTNMSIIAGEESNLRGRILEAAMTSQPQSDDGTADVQPRLAAWLDPAAPGLAAPILNASSKVELMNSELLVSARMSLLPGEPNTRFYVPPDFVTTSIGHTSRSPLFDTPTQSWLGTILIGTWEVGFQIPRGIGNVKPITATLSADLAASHHDIVLRRGQCIDGALHDDPAGPVVAEWKEATGSQKTTFELGDGDVDSNGCLWLCLDVTEAATDNAIAPPWKFNDLTVGFEVQN